jgi:hypothetical protein
VTFVEDKEKGNNLANVYSPILYNLYGPHSRLFLLKTKEEEQEQQQKLAVGDLWLLLLFFFFYIFRLEKMKKL